MTVFQKKSVNKKCIKVGKKRKKTTKKTERKLKNCKKIEENVRKYGKQSKKSPVKLGNMSEKLEKRLQKK